MAGYIAYLKPSGIKYCQNSIANRFQDGKTLKDTLRDLEWGVLEITDIPTIDVYKRGNDWVTKNNRRLWVFRQFQAQGGCTYIPVTVITDYGASMLMTDDVIIQDGHPLELELASGSNSIYQEATMAFPEMSTGEKIVLGISIGLGALAVIGMMSIGAIQRHRDN